MNVALTERERTAARHALASVKKATEAAVAAYAAASLDALQANAQLGNIAGAETKIELPSSGDEIRRQMELEDVTLTGDQTAFELIELHRTVLITGLLLDRGTAESIQKKEKKELVNTGDSDSRIDEIDELLAKLGHTPPQAELKWTADDLGLSPDDIS